VTLEEVACDLRQRDARDSARATAPLKPAADALLLDTSELTIDEAVAAAVAKVRGALPVG
jgi:cytidylate kinase